MSTGANSSTGGSRRKLAPFAASLLGTTIDDRFRIEKAIGQGAMGTVFAATQLSVNRRVAIKVLREQMSDTSKARFMREARVISAISHPNIVQLIDFGERAEDELLYLVMEYVDGLRMSRLIKKGRVHPNLAIEITAQICGALAEAHAQGIVHRDLKPSNVLLVRTADGSLQVKVLDFGVAHTYEDADQLTATGVLCGTPAYMAPEQARGKDVTPRVDLYALGVNLYEMLGGFRPFRGATPVEVAMKQIQQDPPDMQRWVETELLPPPLVEVANALLQKDPAQRPQSASEVRQTVLRIRSTYGWGPVVFPEASQTVWSNWTQPKLANHGGEPLEDGRPPTTSSWSGSWTGRGTGQLPVAGSQPAMHDESRMGAKIEDRVDSQPSANGGSSGGQSMIRPSIPDPGQGEAGMETSAPSHDSLPSRHGGGWDAFRGGEPGELVQQAPQHGKHIAPAPSARVGAATPSEETAHIVQVAERASAPFVAQEPHGDADADAVAEIPAVASAPGTPEPRPSPSVGSQRESFIEETATSYEGMWTAAGESRGEQLPTFHDAAELEVERPEVRGTVVSDFEDADAASFRDLIRFGLVAILVFLVCAAIGYVLLGLGEEKTRSGTVVQPTMVPEHPVEPEALPEDGEKTTVKKKRKKKDPSLKKKKWREPIDVFDDAPAEDSPDRKIVIEEAE